MFNAIRPGQPHGNIVYWMKHATEMSTLVWSTCAFAVGLYAIYGLTPNATISVSALLSLTSLCVPWVLYQLILYPSYLSRFKHLPAPKGRSVWLGNLKRVDEFPGETAQRLIEEVPNDGLIRYYMIGNRERLLVTNAEALSEVLVRKPYDFAKPEFARETLRMFTGNGLLVAEGEEHVMQRKLLMPAFTFRHIKDLYPTFWAKGIQMVREIENHVNEQGGRPVVTMRDWATRATLDIIGVAGMGLDFNTLQHPENILLVEYHRIFPQEQSWLVTVITAVVMTFALKFVIKLPLSRNKEVIKAADSIRSAVRHVIAEKKSVNISGRHGENDILSVAMKSGNFTEEGLLDQMTTFLAAGHETTAAALQWAMYALCKYPDIQHRLRSEIRSNLPSPFTTDDSEAVGISATEIDNLPYLNAFCNEVLRYWPPIRFTFRVAVKDTSILTEFIPKGTSVIISPEVTNRQTSYWGPDAADFEPERWLDLGKANAAGGATNNFANSTFLHGARSCIGRGFARSELVCLVALMSGRFKLSFADSGRVDEELFITATTTPKDGVVALVEALDGW